MLQGSFCSNAHGWSAPTATELYHAAKRSCPSGFADGFRTTTTELRISSVCGSSEAASWEATCMAASNPAGSLPCTEYSKTASAGLCAAIAEAPAAGVLLRWARCDTQARTCLVLGQC